VVCTACASSAFCPLGAVAEVDSSELETISQAQVYPKSPESTIFDEILIQNMFSIGTSFHCVLVSPLFWTFAVMAMVTLILILMVALKFWINHPKKHVWRTQIKNVFRQIDLVVCLFLFFHTIAL
jgi:peptidoglycan/LPS O-acetylase OafA/YrhL